MVDVPLHMSVLCGVFVLAAAVRVLPLRGGRGQHAGAGAGAVSVWQLRETVQAAHREHARTGKHALREFPVELYRPPFPVEFVGVAHPPVAG